MAYSCSASLYEHNILHRRWSFGQVECIFIIERCNWYISIVHVWQLVYSPFSHYSSTPFNYVNPFCWCVASYYFQLSLYLFLWKVTLLHVLYQNDTFHFSWCNRKKRKLTDYSAGTNCNNCRQKKIDKWQKERVSIQPRNVTEIYLFRIWREKNKRWCWKVVAGTWKNVDVLC